MSKHAQKLVASFESFSSLVKTEVQEIAQEREQWEQQKQIMSKHSFKEETVTLNVGGKLFTTAVATLRAQLQIDVSEDDLDDEEAALLKGPQEHFLSALFSGRFDVAKDANGHVVIDRDGEHFRFILNYLRASGNVKKCEFPFHKEMAIKELVHEAEFYNLHHLKLYLKGDLGLNLTKQEVTLIKSWLQDFLQGKKPKFALLYDSKIDPFTPAAFHGKCDNKGATLIIVKLASSNIVCGGFADVPWDITTNNYKAGSKCWLFNLQTKQQGKCTIAQYGIYCHPSYSVTFGGGHDFHVSSQTLSCGVSSYPNIGLPSSSQITEMRVYSVQPK